MKRALACVALWAAAGCAERALHIPLDLGVDLAEPDLLPMHCVGRYSGAITGVLDEQAGCAVFVVDDDQLSIFSLDTFAGTGVATAHALLKFPPEIAVRSYAIGDATVGRVSLERTGGGRWVGGVSASGAATGDLTLRIDQVGDQQLDARGRKLFVVRGTLDATLPDQVNPASTVRVQISF